MRPTINNLPANTPTADGSSSTSAIRRFVEIELQKPTRPAYVIFTNVPPQVIRESHENPRLLGSNAARICYDEELRRLILKLPSNPHELAHNKLAAEISIATASMGLKHQLLPLGAARVTDANISKEPDSSFQPAILPPGRTRKWPTLVIECGYTESTVHLRSMADWWIGSSNGEVMAVILICIGRSADRIIFEKWIPRAAAQRTGPALRSRDTSSVREQEIIVTKGQNSRAVVNGGPLTIGFEEVFLRPPVTPGEHDYVVSHQDLGTIVEQVWQEMV